MPTEGEAAERESTRAIELGADRSSPMKAPISNPTSPVLPLESASSPVVGPPTNRGSSFLRAARTCRWRWTMRPRITQFVAIHCRLLPPSSAPQEGILPQTSRRQARSRRGGERRVLCPTENSVLHSRQGQFSRILNKMVGRVGGGRKGVEVGAGNDSAGKKERVRKRWIHNAVRSRCVLHPVGLGH